MILYSALILDFFLPVPHSQISMSQSNNELEYRTDIAFFIWTHLSTDTESIYAIYRSFKANKKEMWQTKTSMAVTSQERFRKNRQKADDYMKNIIEIAESDV